jgi:hypothetical protein
MAVSNLTTETGDIIVQETVAGLDGASELNDTQVVPINKETFTTDPSTRSWLYGSGWSYSLANGRIDAV